MSQELNAFLAARPELHFIDLLLHDLHGVDRGKRIDIAEANPYLVVSWILRGLLQGLTDQRKPRAPLEGNAYTGTQQQGEPLPRYWPTALDRLDQSRFARELLGADLHRLYGMVKRHELDEFNSHVTARECAAYLPALS
ncbi:MAG: hypothetical protein ABIQ86_06495 [Steroidobacteraceae bacterium]